VFLFLSQLESYGYIRCQVDGLAVAGSGMEANLLRHAARFFVQSVPQAVNHALYQDLAGRRKGYAQNQSPCTRRVRASLVYCTGGLEITSRLVHLGTASTADAGAATACIWGIPADATLPPE